MRAYLIDEISAPDMEKITGFLKKNAIPSKIAQVLWVKIPDDLLKKVQYEHRNCRPHVFAVELGSNWIKLEFFVRSLKNMRCACPAYCTRQQRDYIINFANNMIENLGIRS